MADGSVRDELAAALPEHQSWCHAEAHGECCGADDCDCGVADSLERLLPVVERLQRQAAAEALRDLALEMSGAVALCRVPLGELAEKLRDRADGIEAT